MPVQRHLLLGLGQEQRQTVVLPVGNGVFTNCRIADCLVYEIYCDPVGEPWLGTPIQVFNAVDSVVEHCTIRHCGQAANPKARKAASAGWCCWNATTAWPSSTSATTWSPTSATTAAPFDIDGGCTDCILQYNYSHDNEGSGYQSGPFRLKPPGNNTIRYNISQNDAQKNPGHPAAS